MDLNRLIFDQDRDCFEVTGYTLQEGIVMLNIRSNRKDCECPTCIKKSDRVHSYYERIVRDVSSFDKIVRIHLKARKFYCNNPFCATKIFSERFNSLTAAYQRTTNRLAEKFLKISLLVGGNAGSRLCSTLRIPVSSSTLIRQIHRKKLPEPKKATAVGIDDWAYRKGLRYGTVVVDLIQHKIIDLLPDREAETVTNWLRANPEVEVVSRDRYINYATGVTNALPNAIQVADRWHLIKNLGEAVKRVLQRCQGTLRQKAKEQYQQHPPVILKEDTKPTRSQLLLSRKQELMDRVKAMHKKGTGIRTIARELCLNRNTVRKYLQLDVALPKCSPYKTNLFLFEDYIINAIATRPGILIKDIYKEIKALGYRGKQTTGYANIGKYMPEKARMIYPKELPLQFWRPAEVSLLLYRLPEELKPKELKLVKFLRKESSEVATSYGLFQKFRQMLVEKSDSQLTSWIDEAKACGIKEIQSFANGILNDFSAVKNAFTQPWSNGQVEGQVNKLKMIKRQMYGRASFQLLRKKLLYYASG